MIERCRGNKLRLWTQLRVKLIDPQSRAPGEVILPNALCQRQDFAFRGHTAAGRYTPLSFRDQRFQPLSLRP